MNGLVQEILDKNKDDNAELQMPDLGSIVRQKDILKYFLVVPVEGPDNGRTIALENSEDGSSFGMDHSDFWRRMVVEESPPLEFVWDDRRALLKKYASIEHMPDISKPNTLNQEGVKDDTGKPDIRLLFQDFPRALLAVANNATFGSIKYTPHGWRTVPDGFNRYTSAMGRHLLLENIDEGGMDEDPREYGFEISHMAMVAWNALARLELHLTKQEEENPE